MGPALDSAAAATRRFRGDERHAAGRGHSAETSVGRGQSAEASVGRGHAARRRASRRRYLAELRSSHILACEEDAIARRAGAKNFDRFGVQDARALLQVDAAQIERVVEEQGLKLRDDSVFKSFRWPPLQLLGPDCRQTMLRLIKRAVVEHGVLRRLGKEIFRLRERAYFVFWREAVAKAGPATRSWRRRRRRRSLDPLAKYFRRADLPKTGRGDAATGYPWRRSSRLRYKPDSSPEPSPLKTPVGERRVTFLSQMKPTTTTTLPPLSPLSPPPRRKSNVAAASRRRAHKKHGHGRRRRLPGGRPGPPEGGM